MLKSTQKWPSLPFASSLHSKMCTALVDLSLCQRQKHLNELAICDNFNGDGNSFRSSQVLVHNNSDHNTLTQRTVECACTLETLLLINCSWSPRTKCNLQYTKKYYTMYTRKDTVYGSNVKNYSSLVTHSLTLTHTHTHTHKHTHTISANVHGFI